MIGRCFFSDVSIGSSDFLVDPKAVEIISTTMTCLRVTPYYEEAVSKNESKSEATYF
jgi:hypothetical protein